MAFQHEYVRITRAHPDPTGGGASILVPCVDRLGGLSQGSRTLLEKLEFEGPTGDGLGAVGGTLANYRLDMGDGFFRYTGRHLDDDGLAFQARQALLELDRVLLAGAHRVMLGPNEALIVDQRRTLHGRLPLGNDVGQPGYDSSRLLVQRFYRATAS